jgi:hypothetical protein
MAPIGKMFATVPYPFHDSRLALFMFQISVDSDIVCLPVYLISNMCLDIRLPESALWRGSPGVRGASRERHGDLDECLTSLLFAHDGYRGLGLLLAYIY